MVAARLADVDDLNRRARSVLRAQGWLGRDRVVLAGRAFAEGDDILALRNDYRLGLLNGMRAAIDRFDIACQHIVAVADNDQRLVIPFDYAADGHLTHGYATTTYKAQGATVDRCFVLVDETASREHAYAAVSRGRHGNDLFVVAADRRSEERHAAEVQPDPLDGLRAAVQRSSAQRLALDELQAGSTSQLEQLRRERDLLHARLSQQPPDPSWDVRKLVEDRQREQHDRDGAGRRRNDARQHLDRLGPIGRRAHPARRREIEDHIARRDAEIVRHDVKLADLDRQLEAHTPAVAARTTWERQHAVELQRLHDLDRKIDLIERLDHVATRRLERGAERSLGIEL